MPTAAVKQILFGGYSLTQAFGGAAGFYFDFSVGATGLGIASVASVPPGQASASQGSGSLQPVWTAGPPAYALTDGSDDLLQTTLAPASNMTLALWYRPLVAAGVAMGTATAGPSNRCYLSINASGFPVATWGATAAAGTASILNTDVVQVCRYMGNGALIDVWINGVQVGSGSTSTTPTPNALGIGGIGVLGGGPFAAKYYRAFAVQRGLSAGEIPAFSRLMGRF